MKIRYINESFKKISDLKKDVYKIASADSLKLNEVKKLILPVLENNVFVYNSYVNGVRNIISSDRDDTYDLFNIVSFEYDKIENDILFLNVNLLYNTSIIIKNLNNAQNKNTLQILDNVITEIFYKTWNTLEPDIKIRNIINGVHINKIIVKCDGYFNHDIIAVEFHDSRHSSSNDEFNNILETFKILKNVLVSFDSKNVFGYVRELVKIHKCDTSDEKYQNYTKILKFYKNEDFDNSDSMIDVMLSNNVFVYKLSMFYDCIDLNTYDFSSKWDSNAGLIFSNEQDNSAVYILSTPDIMSSDVDIDGIYCYVNNFYFAPYNDEFFNSMCKLTKNIHLLTILTSNNSKLHTYYNFVSFSDGKMIDSRTLYINLEDE